MTGIVGWGVYIPRMRIKADEFRSKWGSFGAAGVSEKAVPDVDDDVVTMATNAATRALNDFGIDPGKIRCLALASSSFPYEIKFQAGTVAIALGAGDDCFCLQFAGSAKSGLEGLISTLCLATNHPGCFGLVAAGECKAGNVYSSLEHSYGAAGCALIVGDSNVVAQVEASAHYADDVPGERYQVSGSSEVRDIDVREYSEMYPEKAIVAAVGRLLEACGTRPKEYRHLAMTQPDARFGQAIARKLGFAESAMTATDVAVRLGDVGVCGPLIGLEAALENSEPSDRIMVVAYGEGGGVDAVSIGVVRKSEKRPFSSSMSEGEYIDLVKYLKLRSRVT